MIAARVCCKPCAVRGVRGKVQPLPQRCVRVLAAETLENEVAPATIAADDEAEPVFEDAYEIPTLSMEQVHELIKTVSEGTSIAEVHLKLSDLEVKFRRSSGNLPAAPSAMPAAAAAPAAPVFAAPPPLPSVESEDDDDLSESSVAVRSPKVGFMCVHKYVKGNRVGREPMIKVGDKVKKGQTIAYIGQLGTHWPVEAPMSGEVIEIMVKDGEPVEYDQEMIRLVAFFSGHIIGDAKLK